MTEKLILAVDGGATKTALVLRKEHDKQNLFEKTSTSSNYQAIGKDNVLQVLKDLLNDAYESTKLQSIDVAVFAIAGVDTERDYKVVEEIVQEAIDASPFNISNVIVENDVEATLKGLTKGETGALIISGTGAISFATDGKRVVRTGGWGHRVGDEGSGYWIGQQILRAIFQYEDGRKTKPTLLKDLVYKKLNVKNVEQLQNWIYQPSYTNAQVASVCSLLHDAITQGDEVAIDIAKLAAEELSNLAVTTVRKVLSNKDEPFTLYVNGGVFKNNIALFNMFKQFCLKEIPSLHFELCDNQPIEYIIQRAIYS